MAQAVHNDHLTYLVLGRQPWNRRVFEEKISKLPGRWLYISEPQEFSPEVVNKFSPRYLFFLHWSTRVPAEIIEKFECVCFHMTDVPYGRGGSPLQNLIVRGHRETKLTALRMTSEFDAGPVYLKEPLSLEGSAEEIYSRAAELSVTMIQTMIQKELNPTPQQGEVVNFTRRKPEQSRILNPTSLRDLYDFIRMLDADGYPRAFLDYAGLRLEFSRAGLHDGLFHAEVKITAVPSPADDSKEDQQ
jgi:methionyl-tRNA formyltransferase